MDMCLACMRTPPCSPTHLPQAALLRLFCIAAVLGAAAAAAALLLPLLSVVSEARYGAGSCEHEAPMEHPMAQLNPAVALCCSR
jgi:hypothetical protein